MFPSGFSLSTTNLPWCMSLVEVEPSLHAHHGMPREVAKDKVPSVTVHCDVIKVD